MSIATVLLLPINQLWGPQVIALIYLLPIIPVTIFWGLLPGILASFFAFLEFNYFFIPPYHTFSVIHTKDLITLIVFLIVSIAINQLIGQARQGMQIARNREWEATRMYELISALAGSPDDQSIARTLSQSIFESFHCRQVETVFANRLSTSSISIRIPKDSQISSEPTLQSSIMTARSQEGTVCLWLGPGELDSNETRLLDAFTTQAALAIERIRLSGSEARAKILEETDRAKSLLLSSVSHELRSPLASIKASISSLNGELVDWNSDARHDLLETIEEETDHLNQLIGNLLDMSRIEAGALKLQRSWNSLDEITKGVVNRMRKQLQNHQVSISIPASIPLVSTDYVLISQVFTNLIDNSIKFAPPGTTIEIIALPEPAYVHVEVTNQGPMVPEEQIDHIFEKFNRQKAGDRVTGTGLGLSICKGIIEAHGGTIWAENSECCFAFHFRLPLIVDGKSPRPPVEAAVE